MTVVEYVRGFLNRYRRPEGQRSFVGRKQGGVVVTEDTAGTYSAVAACDRIISETMAAMPWQVFRKAASGRDALPSHGVQWLLNFQANPEQTAYVFRRTKVSNYLMWGTSYSEIERGLDGRPVWLWWLPPDRSCLERSETGALVVRTTGGDGQQYILPRDNVFMLSDGSFDGLTGVSRIGKARRAIGAGIAGDVMAASLFENGAAIGGTITQETGKTLTPEARKVLLDSFNEQYAGPARAGKWVYVDGGMKATPGGGMPMTDAQFIENRRNQIQEIARWFGVPLHLLQDMTDANYAISYEASKNFVEHTLRPIAVMCEQEANVRLFGARSQSAVYSRMNLSSLMRADPRTRGEWYRSLVNAGIMSINEVRELEELNSIGPDGDEHYMQLNMTTVEKIASGDSLKVPPKPAPASDPTPPIENTTQRIMRALLDAELRGEARGREDVNAEAIALVARAVAEHPAPTINVQPAAVTMAAPVVNVAPEVNVPATIVNVAPAAVTVQPTVVNVAAPEVSVAAPVVNVAAAEVNVPAPVVNIEPAQVSVAAPVVNVEASVIPAPVVNVAAPNVKIAAPEVNVTPEITVNAKMPERKKRTRKVTEWTA